MVGKNRWLGYLFAYILWIIAMALGILFLLIGQNSFPILFASLVTDKALEARNFAVFFDRLFTILVGIAWIAMLVSVEAYFRNAVPKGLLQKRAARVIGILLAFVAAADILQLVTFASNGVSWQRLLIIASEVIFSILLIYFSIRKKTPVPETEKRIL